MVASLAAAAASVVLVPHGAHGVGGTVTFARVSAHATRVTVTLRVHDHRLRPLHIHGGRCGSFLGLGALRRGPYAIDVHAAVGSPDRIACASL